MKKHTRVLSLLATGLAAVALFSLAGCASGGGRGPGPLQSFAVTAAANPGLPQTVVGVIDERQEPKVISVVVPPGTAVGALVATLSLKGEAVISVVSTGAKVVQANGSTPNDFSVPVLYSIEVPGDKKAWQYTVTVRQADTEARLASVSFPDGYTLVPAFNSAINRYSVEVPFATTSVRIALRAISPWLANMNVAGTSSVGAAAGVAVPFASGPQQSVRIETLAEDGVSRSSYEIVVRRGAPDRNAALAGLEVVDGALAPVFNPGLSGYHAEVAFAAKTVVVRAWPQSRFSAVALSSADQGAAEPLRVSGDPASKAGARLDFSAVDIIPLVVTVTAQDGSVRQYALNISRGEPDHNYFLGSLSVDNSALGPAFAANVYAYRAMVPFAARQLIVRARPSSAQASLVLELAPAARTTGFAVRGDPASAAGATVDFPSGDAVGLRITVTAEDGNAVRYNMLVVRGAPDRNADLQTLAPNAGVMQPAFAPKIAAYAIRIPASVESVQLSAAAASPVGRVAVIEQPGLKPARSQTIAVAVGAGETTVANITVTAEDGTQRLYRVQVSRDALPPAPPPQPKPDEQKPGDQKPGDQKPPVVQTEQPVSVPSHVVVSMKNLRVPDAVLADLGAKGEVLIAQARITLRYYRTDAVLQQGSAPVEFRAQIGNSSVSIDYRSAEVALDRRDLVEIEVAIPTTGNRYLSYSEARPVDSDMRIEPSFLLLGKDAKVAWPAPGSPVKVAGYYSVAREDRDQAGPATVLEIADPSTGKVLARENISSRGRWKQGALATFDQPLALPEGATVRYSVQGQAKGGAAWQATGTARVWTVGLDAQGGPAPAVIFGIDDSSPVKQPGGGGDRDQEKGKKN